MAFEAPRKRGEAGVVVVLAHSASSPRWRRSGSAWSGKGQDGDEKKRQDGLERKLSYLLPPGTRQADEACQVEEPKKRQSIVCHCKAAEAPTPLAVHALPVPYPQTCERISRLLPGCKGQGACMCGLGGV